MTDQTATMTMDLEGELRFAAHALHVAPSGEIVPGTDYAVLWQSGVDGRAEAIRSATDLLEKAVPSLPGELASEIVRECDAMRAAIRDEDREDSFHLYNWHDKPHRLAYGAMDLMERAADALAAR